MSDFERITTVIEYLNTHRRQQPSLEELADVVELSPFHFQRLFTRWAGVSPKKFLQCLTVRSAGQQLRNGRSVLDAALDEGLSGPGRLHDLTVLLEAASPGEIKAGGQGWTITAGFADSPFGTCMIAESPRGVCRLSFVDRRDQSVAEEQLAADWPNARLQWDHHHATAISERIFLPGGNRQRKSSHPPLQCLVKGTEFQVKVWRALLKIPYGELTTYGHIADATGHAKAGRAVGSAVGRNEIGYLIPCHRVIRDTGVVGEYRWGSVRKQAMIASELARCTRGAEPSSADVQ